MAEFETLANFLEHVSLVMEAQSKDNAANDAVTIMTLHGAKGLEFPVVFLPGWEEELFPSQRSMDENGIKGLEEERRLAYVGITRARQRAIISFAANRRLYGNWTSAIPSRFIDELPPDHIESAADIGLYEAGRSVHWDSSGFSGAIRTVQTPIRPPQRMGRVSVSGYKSGDRVTHDSFGPGTVIHVDGNKLDILFDGAGQKRLMESFVQKAED
jgi:DNA helicase-2/ATP-dependent DNA helicase PcrA